MDTLEEMGLAELRHRRPAQLSGGEQQRVAIARAIAADPKIVFADEPTANLDSKASKKLLRLLRDLNKKRNVTFLFSSHDPLVLDFATRIIHIQDGRIMDETCT